MKKVIAGVFISLDGVVENPQDWHFPYFNDEMGAAVSATLGRADTVLFGRVTYDSFAGAWPERELAGEADADMARALGDARKIVVSRQHLEFTWRNSEQLNGDLVEAVAALKQEPGEGTIGMSGSVSVVRQLLAAGLIDELHLLVHPIAMRKACGCSSRANRQSRSRYSQPTPLRPACSTWSMHLLRQPLPQATWTPENTYASETEDHASSGSPCLHSYRVSMHHRRAAESKPRSVMCAS